MGTVPPPPPLPSNETEETLKNDAGVENIYNLLAESEKSLWAEKYPELREACIRNQICNDRPFKYHYREIPSVLQEGPTCGLVALSMLTKEKVSPKRILEIAKENGFTNNGEMFSCTNMIKLAEIVLQSVDITDFSIRVEKGDLYDDKIVEKLLDGAVLLVPYDADFDHRPCLKQGNKSHWSIICGVLIISENSSYTEDLKNVYVMAKHGKSKYLALWSLNDLRNSNQNLCEFAARKGETLSMYVMPEGGVGGENGLKSQFLIVDNVTW